MKTENLINPASFPETKEVYEAPVIETVEIKVERGFEDSILESDEYTH